MDSRTGELHTLAEVQEMPQAERRHMVELTGEPEAIERVSRSVKDSVKAKAKRKAAKASRKRNRR